MTTEDDRPVPGDPEPGAADSAGPPPSPEAAADAPEPDEPRGRVIRRSGSSRPPESLPDAPAPAAAAAADPPRAMIPARGSRPPVEAALMRTIATAGIIGISVAIAAIMGSQNSKGWLIGLVTSIVSVILAAVLWSSRRL